MVILLFTGVLLSTSPQVSEKSPGMTTGDDDRLAVLWTSADPDVAKKMVFLYAMNAKKLGWFKQIRFIIWGPSAKLLSENKELQDMLKKMKDLGVELFACKWCSDSYGVSEALEKMGVKVIYYGKPLTKLLKDDWKILTF
jgi:hypothetical protein